MVQFSVSFQDLSTWTLTQWTPKVNLIFSDRKVISVKEVIFEPLKAHSVTKM